MSNVLILYQCHFKTCCYNVTLTSYRWLYQHWTLNVLLRCCKSTHIKKGQVCDASLWWVKSQGWKRKENFNLPPYGHDLTPRGKKNPINLGGHLQPSQCCYNKISLFWWNPHCKIKINPIFSPSTSFYLYSFSSLIVELLCLFVNDGGSF